MRKMNFFIKKEISKPGERILMKKKRTIRLKDPKLRKIRTELRTLLVREADKRILDLIDKQSSLLDEPSFDGEKDSLLENQKNKLRKLLKASICSCATCSDMKKDHVFTPKTREWYCEKCLERLEKANYFQRLDDWKI
jgi:hypothetical protein